MQNPGCLSAVCIELAQDAIAKGCIQYLVRSGGWRHDRFLVKGQPTRGRIWERIPLESRQLAFGPAPLEFLMWLTEERASETKLVWDPPASHLSAADQLFFSMAYDALRGEPEIFQALQRKSVFSQNALCWFANPGEFANPDAPEPPAMAPWMTGVRAAILECLQPLLAQRWIRSERNKGQIGDWRAMRQKGLAERATLSALLNAAHEARRTDLARFVLNAAATILAPDDLTPGFWTGGLQTAMPPRLADRLETQRAALALPQQMETLQHWDRRARSVSYFDEDYAASQLWKEDWEQAHGEVIAAHARQVLEQLDPLRTS
jgi:hypothetical protein